MIKLYNFIYIIDLFLEFVNVFSDFTKKYGRLCRFEVFTISFLVTSDYKFTEFLLTSNKILNKSTEYVYLNKWLGTGLLTAPGMYLVINNFKTLAIVPTLRNWIFCDVFLYCITINLYNKFV